MARGEDIGKLLVRFTLGFLFLFHTYAHVFLGDPGPPTRIAAWGLPYFVNYIAFAAEFFGAAFCILGVYARIGGFLLAAFMFAAFVMAHAGLMGMPNHLFERGANPQTGVIDRYGLEPQLFYLTSALAVMFFGAGRLGLNIGGKWNN